MTAEEVATVGLIGLIICALLLPTVSATFAPPVWCYGLAVVVWLVIFLSGVICAIILRLTASRADSSREDVNPNPANNEQPQSPPPADPPSADG